MPSRFITALSVIAVIVLLALTVLLNPKASASPKEVTVISRTSGNEVLTGEVLDQKLRIKLKNNHKKTITAFAISFDDTVIREDFAYSEVHSGIEPGDSFEKSYSLSPPHLRSEPLTLHLLTVLLDDGTKEGDSKVAQQMRDGRLGQKIQILRTLRIFENEDQSLKDLKATKSSIVAALDNGELEVFIILKEIQPTSRLDTRLSDDLRNGLHWGREKMLRRFEEVEQLPTEHREQAFRKLKDRLQKLFAKL